VLHYARWVANQRQTVTNIDVHANFSVVHNYKVNLFSELSCKTSPHTIYRSRKSRIVMNLIDDVAPVTSNLVTV